MFHRHLTPRRSSALLALTLAAGLAVPFFASPTSALAHERREVGRYQFVVGFLTEPAIQGEPNGVDLRIVDRETQKPVEGADKSLKVAVAFGGGQAKEFPLRARFNAPGSYAADLIPTRSGSYVFTFSGTIDGQPISEKFESGPGRFNDVQSATSLQFPAADPSAAELQRALDETRQQAATANTLALASLAVGALSLLLAGYLLLSRRSAAPAGALPAEARR